MRPYLTKFLILMGLVGLFGSCSLKDQDGFGDYELDELILDDFEGEAWDGVGLPSWLRERYFKDFFSDLGWCLESYCPTILVRVYSFEYRNNVLLVLSSDFFANRKHESCSRCYTNDGRKIDFKKINGYFEKNASLIWSNAFDGENIPQVSDFKLDFEADLDWLQLVINQICENIHEPDMVLAEIICGIVEEDGQKYVALQYKYYDSSDMSKGPVNDVRLFHLDGQTVFNVFDISQMTSSHSWYLLNGFEL